MSLLLRSPRAIKRGVPDFGAAFELIDFLCAARVRGIALFTAAGEYLLRVQANDESGEGGFGFQCCWTNTYVKVTVR